MASPPAPDDIVRTAAEGQRGEREPLLVIEPLLAFLEAAGLEAPADLGATPVGDGHSNVTFALSTGVILRRPPRGPLPPSAHDVLREARLLRALAPTSARTPRVLAACADPGVIGAPFYLMERVAGEVITSDIPAPLDTPAGRAQIASELVDALVELHEVEWSELALDGFGRPSGYLERQLRRFGGLWEHNRTREVPEVAEVGRWLAEHLPPERPARIVHGDYRLGNVMFGAQAPARLVAVFDWEMATIGDPLADVGYMLSHWRERTDPPSRFSLQAITERDGFPDRRGLIELYAQRAGRSVEQLDWYIVLAVWKSVVFMEGNYRRAVSGATDDPYLRSFGEGVVELARRALQITREGY
jgi:aminoglycoside phosphotransferase (APT) family kinase protein